MPKISELTASTAIAGTEVLPVVQSSTTKKATIASLGAGLPQLFKYTYDVQTVEEDPGVGKLRLSDTDLTAGSNIVIVDDQTNDGLTISSFIVPAYMKVGGFVLVRALTSANFIIGTVTSVTDGAGFSSLTITRIDSSATFTDGEALCLSYFGNGNVTYNSVTGNLEVAGVSIGNPAGAGVQQYFSYTYDNTIGVTTDPGVGIIRFNDTVMSTATACYLDNKTNDPSDAPVLSNTFNNVRPGWFMRVQAKNALHFALFRVTSITDSTGFRTLVVARIDSIDFTNGEDVTVNFFASGNVEHDDATNTLRVNNEVISNVVSYDTMTEALSTQTISADTDNLEFIVRDPGGNSSNDFLEPVPWNIMVDNTAGKLRQMHGMSDFATNKTIRRYRQPAVAVSARATDSTILAARTKLTATAHGIETGVPAVDTYVVVKTTSGGWTTTEQVKILNVDTANTFIVDKLFSGVSGNPVFYLITEVMPVLLINNPPLGLWSELLYLISLEFPFTAGTKTIAGNLGGTTYWGGASTVFASNRGVTRTIRIKNLGSASIQTSSGAVNTNTGTDASTTATHGSSTIATGTSSNFNMTIALSAAADWVDIVIANAGARL